MQAARARGMRWGGLLLLVLALAAVAWAAWRRAPDPDREPLVIGLLQAVSGPMARSEAAQGAAARLAVQEINEAGGLLGRRVVLQVEDTRADLRTAAAAAERLITRERAVALFGCGTVGCRQSVAPIVEAHRHLLFYPAAYEGMETSAHIVYAGPTPNQQALPAVHWAMERFGRRVLLVGSDTTYSRRLAVVLRDFIPLTGGQVVGEASLPAGDAAPVSAALHRFKPDVVVSHVCGDDNRAVFDRWVADGHADLPLLSLCAAEPEMQAYEGGRLTRHFTAWGYLQSLPDAANQAFVAKLRASQGAQAVASDAAVSTYVALKLWAAAVRELGSARTDAVNANVVHQSLAAPQGHAAVDAQSRHLWRPLRIAQVRPDGQLAEVMALPRFIRPEPWPSFRPRSHWIAALPPREVPP